MSVMVAAGVTRPLATGARTCDRREVFDMGKCTSVIVSDSPEDAGCPGHLGKFDSCLAEALYEWTLDEAFHDRDDATGSTEFEGCVTALIVERAEEVTIDPDGEARTVLVPPAAYLVWADESGSVTLTEAEDAQGAREIVRTYAVRYEAWERGCDPDRPQEHEGCLHDFQCAKPDWADA